MLAECTTLEIEGNKLYLPPNIGVINNLALRPEYLSPPGRFLVVRNPMDYLRSCYHASNCMLEFKRWYFGNIPLPQTSYLPNYSQALRVEYFEKDCYEEGLVATIRPFPVDPNIYICLATRADIRRRFTADYEAGEYD